MFSASKSNKIPLLYDTGASRYFISSKRNFTSLYKRSRQFNFDQAVGAMSLTYQDTAVIKVGALKLQLRDTLYSPNSTCNIISAGRLQKSVKLRLI